MSTSKTPSKAKPAATRKALTTGAGKKPPAGPKTARLPAPVSPNRSRLERDKLLQTIRSAALDEFSQYGFRGASTQSIADRAGLSKPQLHYYIAGKEELYEEILSSVLAGRLVNLDAPPAAADPRTALGNYIRRKLDYAMDNPALSRVFTQEIMAGGPYLEKHWQHTGSDVLHNVGVIEGWITQGLIRPVNPRLLLIHIWAMTQYHADNQSHAQAVLSVGNAEPASRDDIASEITAMVLAHCGLRKKPAGNRGQNPIDDTDDQNATEQLEIRF